MKASKAAARILADLESSGKPIDLRDVFIGATALVNDHAVLTRNMDHISKIPDLKALSAP